MACETEEFIEITSPEPALVLQEPGISGVFLNFSLPANNAFTISWNDDLTGSSTYDVEMSLDDAFTSPVTLGSVSTNSFSINVEDLNTAIRNAGSATFKDIAVYIRVKTGSIISNTILFLVTTYPIENPQIISPVNTFEIVLSDITENDTALTVEWDDPFTPEDNSTTVNYYVEAAVSGTDFTTIREMGNTQELTFSLTHAELNDIATSLGIEPETAGGIDIRVRSVIVMTVGNLVRISDPITITVTPYTTALPPVLYVVGAGAADAGWSWSNPVSFPLSGVVYSANINLTPDNGGSFRFFLQQDWGPDSYNYPYFEDRGYTIDPNLVNANDGDSNFQFIGTAGLYNLRIDTANKTITLSDPVYGPAISDWGVVGSGYNNWGAFADGAFYSTSDPNVIVSYVTLVTGEIKFRLNNDWGTNYGDNGADGTLEQDGSNIAVTDGTYRIMVNTSTFAYTIEPYSFGIVGSGYNDWGATPDAKFYYDPTSDTWKVGVKLIDGEIKVRLNNDWGLNYGDSGADGTLDQDGNNIPVTAGYYLMTLDLNNGTYALQAANVWGIVGSGYNDWGATPDFSLTQINSDTIVGDIVTLIDGEIKFRINEDWGVNYGDNGADGTLDQDGGNIAVTAGQYRVVIDLVSNTYKLNKVQ
ncbi:MAG TPA: SusE domain-containing protein [Flavobacteriaceae bacterium]